MYVVYSFPLLVHVVKSAQNVLSSRLMSFSNPRLSLHYSSMKLVSLSHSGIHGSFPSLSGCCTFIFVFYTPILLIFVFNLVSTDINTERGNLSLPLWERGKNEQGLNVLPYLFVLCTVVPPRTILTPELVRFRL